MIKEFIERENEIFDIIQKFSDLEFILIGGYAVSAYKHRFSVDADVMIRSEDLDKFIMVLKKNGFEETISKELENIYSTQFKRFDTSEIATRNLPTSVRSKRAISDCAQKHAPHFSAGSVFDKKKKLSVSVDLLIGGMGIRQTESAISFETLYKHSEMKKIVGIEREIKARIPIKEMIMALKIQAGRLTDFRDFVALSDNFDREKVKELMGNNAIVRENLNKLINLLDKKEFMDSFKGVFMEKRFKPRIDLIRGLGLD